MQNTIEAKESSVEKCYVLSETNLPLLKIKLDETLTLCDSVLNRGVNQEAVSIEKKHIESFNINPLRMVLKKAPFYSSKNAWTRPVWGVQKFWIVSWMIWNINNRALKIHLRKKKKNCVSFIRIWSENCTFTNRIGQKERGAGWKCRKRQLKIHRLAFGHHKS